MRGPNAARRTLVALALLLALLASARLVRVLDASNDTLHLREIYVFGSISTVTLAGLDDEAAGDLLDRAEVLLGDLHRELHPWEPSPLTQLNAALAAGAAATTTPGIAELIERSQALVEPSGGRFDPGIGLFVERYGFHTSDYPVTAPAPDVAALAALRAPHPSILAVDLAGESVRSRNRAVQLDFNAVAEGYAAEQIGRLVRRAHATGALIALGGDLYALGDANGRAWKAAIRDPDGGVLGTVELADGEALFSSGAYGRYRQVAGERWPHIIDPRTAEPARGVLATAVLARDPFIADATATALMMAPDDFVRVMRAMGAASALIVDDAGTVHVAGELATRIASDTRRRVVRATAP